MSAYLAIKHLHVVCITFSGLGFFLRGLLMLSDSPLLQRRWLRTVPHVNDTILLATAVTLTVLTSQYPLVNSWVTAKVFGLIGYIILGSMALRPGHSKAWRCVSWLLALLAFTYIASVALTHDPRGILALLKVSQVSD